MKKAILIQARLSSSRFPGKMMYPLSGVPLVEFVFERCRHSKKADVVAIITSTDTTDDILYEYCKEKGIDVFRGSLNNVLERYIRAAECYKAEVVCRVCGDSPFVDVNLIDSFFELSEFKGIGYIGIDKATCIAGLDFEIVRYQSLIKSLENTASEFDLEHVTPYIKNHLSDFRGEILSVNLRPDSLKGISLTIDYKNDLFFCDKIANYLSKNYDFLSSNILSILINNPDLLALYQTRGIEASSMKATG